MIEVIHATYGHGQTLIDVTVLLKTKKLCFLVSNALFGDPCVGKVKVLILSYRDDKGTHTKITNENEYVFIPDTETKNIGIFYSNNNHKKVIDRVLQQLHKAKNVDIITCPWETIDNNPFPEFLSPVKVASHLTITLQILKLLNVANALRRYERVYFLEHDVLYPETYFDVVGTHNTDVNANYMGLCSDGWQPVHPDHEPLHQMSMSLPFAIQHFHNKLDECLVKGSCILEPDEKHKLRTTHAAAHINHGKHFTSHFSIYDRNKVIATDPYWGDATDWWDNY